MSVAISLSGGGSKGDFEVGTLHYLYGQGIRPQILCTTSVGSVNGLKLCEGEGGPDQGLQGLTKTWLSLQSDGDFFAVQPWLNGNEPVATLIRQVLKDFAALNPRHIERDLSVNASTLALVDAEERAVKARIDGLLAPILGTAFDGLGVLVRSQVDGLFLGGALSPVNTATAIDFAVRSIALAIEAKTLADEAMTQAAIFNLEPTRRMAAAMLDRSKVAAWAAAGNRLRMAAVGLRSGELRYVTETGLIVRKDDPLGADPETGAAAMSPLCQAAADLVAQIQEQIDEAQGANPRGTTPAGLARRLAAAKKALNDCMRANPGQPQPVRVDLVTGMMASAAIPVFFPYVSMGKDQYVDGGLREVLPVEVALDIAERLQDKALTVYAISAGKARIDRMDPDEKLTMLSIASRSLMEIAIDEVALSDVFPLMRSGAYDIRTIYPRVDIHTIYCLYPAFVRNRMAYGYMCAADAIHPPANVADADRARAIADEIAVLRYGVARLECWLNHRPIPPANVVAPWPAAVTAQSLYNDVKAMKERIGALVAERRNLGAGMPPETTEWGNSLLWSTRPEAYPGAPAAGVDDAALDATVPNAAPAGGRLKLTVVARNTGTSNWSAADGYALQIGPGFNAAPMPAPGTTVPGASATFSLDLAMPAVATDFACGMARQGVAFGGRVVGRVVATASGEPARCKTIRNDLAKWRTKLEDQESSLTGDVRTDARIRAAMISTRKKIADLEAEGKGLGCAL